VRAPLTLGGRVRHWIRIRRLNRMPGIRVAPSTYLGKGVLIQTACDGGAFGGRVAVADQATLSDGVIIAPYGGSIEIKEYAYIGPYCVLYGHGGLVIGRNAMIAAHTVIVPASHTFARIDVPMSEQPTTAEGIEIADDVWIGSGVRVLDGVRIGRGAVIGAGSVVTRDIEPYGVASGVPARVVWNRASAISRGGAGVATDGGPSFPRPGGAATKDGVFSGHPGDAAGSDAPAP
jgi:acetyltransferase-like isoleucine patch superfamily enzyme